MDKLASWLRSSSLRNKLLLTSIACLLIPTLITLSVSNVLTRGAVKQQAEANAAEQLKLVDGYLSNLLGYMLNISNYIIAEPRMSVILKQQAAGKTYSGDDAEYREFADRNEITRQIDNISIIGEKTYVTILLSNGRFFMNYPLEEFNPLQLFDEPWFDELKALTGMEAYWVESQPSPFKIEKAAGRHQITVARTLRRPNFDIFAYVFVTVPDNQVNDIFKQLAEGQEIMLVDGEGRIMAHLDADRIGDKLTYMPETDGSASSIVRLDEEDYLLSQQPLGHGIKNWKLVMLTPYKEAVSTINAIYQSVFVFQIIAFAAFLLLLVVLIRAFTRRLVRLGKLAHTVQRGNLEVRSYIQGEDEIGRLGSSFDQMLDRIKHMIAEITAEQSRKRKAELAMLQAQINPHFLFNVLNSIRMKVLRKGDKDSADMIAALSRLLRMTIGREEESVTLHEELSTAIDYVNLMNMRKKGEVRLDVDVASDAMLTLVPRFFLQPLIENALIHGFERETGAIAVSARLARPGIVEIVLRDDGAGMEPEALLALRRKLSADPPRGEDASGERGVRLSGIGLANVSERMRMRFGESFAMDVDSEAGRGTAITMRFPLEEAKNGHV